ncbi:MULE transposase domain-containing protein [Pseudoscourfieldia marina]
MVSTRTTAASNSVNALRKAQTRSARKRGCDDGAGVGGAGGGASATPHITAGGGNAGNAAHAQPTKRKRGAALTVVDAAGGGTCEGAIAASDATGVDAAGGGTCEGAIAASDATGVDAAGGGDAAQETSPVGLDTLAAVTATSSSSKKPLSWVEIVRMPVAKGDDAALTALKRSSGHALTKKRTRKVASDFLDKDGNALFNTDFRMFLTTPRLLRNVDAQTRATGGNMFIATDGTYKVNLEGRPLIPVGTLDADRHYRDVGVVLIAAHPR